MKIVAHNGSRVWGGNEKWLVTLLVGLRDRRADVLVSCRPGAPVWQRLADEGIRTTPVRPRGDLDLISGWRFARMLAHEKPDVVLGTSWNRLPWLVRAARRVGVPRVVVRLGIVRALRPGRHARAVRRGVHAIIVNSRDIRDELLRSAPWLPPDRVHVVFNGVPAPDPPPPDFRERFRAEMGISPTTPLIAGVGHVYPRKGFDVLIDALATIPPEAHLVIVGDGPHRPELEARARDLDVDHRVHWTGFRTDVANVLSACDAFALGSRNEGMANVMLEAMAARAPVVATDISGVRAALDPRDGSPAAGWVVPVDDPDAMGAALTRVLSRDLADREQVERRRVEARRRVEHDYSIDRMIDEAARVLSGRTRDS